MTFRYMLVVWVAPILVLTHQPRKADAAKRTSEARKALKVKSKTKSTRRRSRTPRRRDLWPPMRLEQVNTREKLTVRLYDRRGRTIKKNVQRIYRLMRCHQTGRHRLIHWRLIRALYKISRHYKGKTIRIYSGYRARKVAQLSGSYHIRGRAMDLAVRGVNKRSLRDYLRRTFKRSGVGYYPNTPFVHFDIRKKRAFWVDVSGSGDDSRYVQAYDYLKQERNKRKARGKGKLAKTAAAKPTGASTSTSLPTAGGIVGAVKAGPVAGGKITSTKKEPASPVSGPPKDKPQMVHGPDPVGPAPAKTIKAKPSPAKPSPPAKDDTSDNNPSRRDAPVQELVRQAPAQEPNSKRAPVSKIRSAP